MKNSILYLWAAAFLFILTGCNAAYMSSPGPVLGSDSGRDYNRIVTFDVVGKGVEPEAALTKGQARLMAERAAVADGYRQFVEKLRGVYVEAYMKAGFGAVEQDILKTHTQSILRGVKIKEITHGDYGIASAAMSLRVNFTRHGMIWWPQGMGVPNSQSTMASLKRESTP